MKLQERRRIEETSSSVALAIWCNTIYPRTMLQGNNAGGYISRLHSRRLSKTEARDFIRDGVNIKRLVFLAATE